MPRKDLSLANNVLSTKPQQSVDLFDLDGLEDMSYAAFKEKKDMLSLLRQKVMLQVDGRKLQQTIQIMDRMDWILDRMIKGEEDEDGNICYPSAKEIQSYSSALKNLSDIVRTLARLDTIDGYGTAREINIKIV